MLLKCSFLSASKVQGYGSKQMPECVQRNTNLFAKKWNVPYYDKKRWTEQQRQEEITECFLYYSKMK